MDRLDEGKITPPLAYRSAVQYQMIWDFAVFLAADSEGLGCQKSISNYITTTLDAVLIMGRQRNPSSEMRNRTVGDVLELLNPYTTLSKR